MAKKRQENSTTQASEQQAKPRKPQRATSGLPWHPMWRTLVSLLVLLHLLAVFSAPWDLATSAALPPGFVSPNDSLGRPQPPPREVWQEPIVTRRMRSFFNHYLNLLYLNHGYEFFAPDPAGTHVIDYRVNKFDGSVEQGRFPDLSAQWPRLFYHRHMMLAEQSEMINNQLVLMAEQTGVRKPFSGQVYAEHLATRHGGHARLDLKIHMLTSPERVLAGKQLDDPSTYRTLGTVDGSPRPKRNQNNSSNSGSESPISIPGAGR